MIMPALRAVRLLNSIEAGTTDAAAFQAFLTDAGRLGEFTVLLSMRGHARRVAVNSVTMDAVIGSPLAVNAVFGAATPENFTAATAIAASSSAMNAVSESVSTLEIVSDNASSWAAFSASAHYETYVLNVLHMLSGETLDLFATVPLFIANGTAMAGLTASDRAVRAAIASPTTVELIFDSASASASMIGDGSAMALIVNDAASMATLAGASVGVAAFTAGTRALIASVPSAIKIMAASSNWSTVAAATIQADMFNIITGINGLDRAAFADVPAIFADPTAAAVIAASAPTIQAIAAVPATLTELIASPNLDIFLADPATMGVFGPDTAVMTTLLGTPAAIAPLFASSAAKGYIVSSTTLVDLVNIPATISYLEGIAFTAIPASNRSSTSAADDPFDGIPNKVLTLSMRANNIGAIGVVYSFNGSPAAGTGATSDVTLAGTSSVAKVGGFTSPTWTVAGIAVTSASSPEWVYVDMT
jgi:hypothetical protein